MFLLLLPFQSVGAQSGTCGTNVKYTISGNTISFSKSNSGKSAVFTSSCTDIFRNNYAITKVEIKETISLPQDSSSMFVNCSYVQEMDLNKFDTSNVTDMHGMFGSCSSLTSLDVSKWDTSSVTDMRLMFGECSSLTSLDVSKWDTSKVLYMGLMFEHCSSLTSLDVSKWDTSKVIYMGYNFYACNSLTGLDVSKWDTSKVTYMGYMFGGCSSLTNLDVSKWDTSKVTDMQCMFDGCSSLTSLDVSEWDTSSVTYMSLMFSGCDNLSTLTLGEKTLKQNIFESLPAYNATWYYISAGTAAVNPLQLKTAKSNGTLFTGYDYKMMAGTWSTDKNQSIKTLDMKLFAYGQKTSEVTILEYNDGNLILPSIQASDEFTLQITASQAAKETVTLPAGISFSKDTYLRSKTVSLSGSSNTLSIPLYSVYHKQSVSSITIEASGDISSKLNITVKKGEQSNGNPVIWIRENSSISNHSGPYKEAVTPNWNTVINETYVSNEAILALDLACASYNEENTEKSLHNLGFTNIVYYPSKFLNTSDPMACAYFLAQKKIPVNNEIKTIIAVVIRGTQETGEWIGNAMSAVGDSEPSTFSTSANRVYDSLVKYCDLFGITTKNAVPFVSGHSRGAAAAAILGHKINTSQIWYKSVTYTFAAPNSVRSGLSGSDKNIFNYVFAHDIVPYVPQHFIKYGSTYMVGASGTPSKVSQTYKQYTSRNYEKPDNSMLIDLLIRVNRTLVPKTPENGDESLVQNIMAEKSILDPIINKVNGFNVGLAHGYENYIAWLKGNGINGSISYEDNRNPVWKGNDFLDKIFHAGLFPDQVLNDLHNRMLVKIITSIDSLFSSASLAAKSGNAEVIFTIASGSVDLKLYDKQGKVAASIIGHQTEYVTESDDYYAFSDGTKDYIYYSAGSGYYLEFIGNNSGKIKADVYGLADQFDIKDTVSFSNIAIKKNEQFRLTTADAALKKSTLKKVGTVKESTATQVLIVDKDDLTKTIDLGTTGEPWQKLTYQLGAVVRPSGKTQKVTWKSSNTSVATVSSTGLVTGKKAGTVKITATAADGSNKSAAVTLKITSELQMGSLIVSGVYPVGVGNKITLKATIDQKVQPSNAKMTWTSSDTKIAKVSSSGVVTGVKEGESTITVCLTEGKNDCVSVEISVLKSTTKVNIFDKDGINITGKTVTADEKNILLKANPAPASASYNFVWSSSDPKIAVVDDGGFVTFLKSGTVKITATALDGTKKASSVTLKFQTQKPVLEIKDTNIRGKNKEVQIVVPWSSDLIKVECTLYDDSTGKEVKPTFRERMDSTGKNKVVSYVGDPLVNGNVYRFKLRVYNGQWSNYVEKYAMPISNVFGATVVAGNKAMMINTQHREPATGTRYMVFDAATQKELAYKAGTKTDTTWKHEGLQNGKLYYVVAVPYRDYKGQRLWGPNENRIYFIPMAIPTSGKVSFSGSNATVSIAADSTVDGILVLYRTVGGALKNGCEAKGAKCTIKGLNSGTAYEFYAMKYKVSEGKTYYSTGTLIPYKTTASGLTAPQMNPVVAMSNSGYTTFTIRKSSNAEGISVLYKIGSGNFVQACEAVGNSCATTLDISKNYTFFIMQYKTVNGKKVYSPGIVARDFTSMKNGEFERMYTGFTLADESIDMNEIYDVLDGYMGEDALLMAEALAVMGEDMVSKGAEELEADTFYEDDGFDYSGYDSDEPYGEYEADGFDSYDSDDEVYEPYDESVDGIDLENEPETGIEETLDEGDGSEESEGFSMYYFGDSEKPLPPAPSFNKKTHTHRGLSHKGTVPIA